MLISKSFSDFTSDFLAAGQQSKFRLGKISLTIALSKLVIYCEEELIPKVKSFVNEKGSKISNPRFEDPGFCETPMNIPLIVDVRPFKSLWNIRQDLSQLEVIVIDSRNRINTSGRLSRFLHLSDFRVYSKLKKAPPKKEESSEESSESSEESSDETIVVQNPSIFLSQFNQIQIYRFDGKILRGPKGIIEKEWSIEGEYLISQTSKSKYVIVTNSYEGIITHDYNAHRKEKVIYVNIK